MTPDFNAMLDHYVKKLAAAESQLALAVGHNVALSKALDEANKRIAELTPPEPPPADEASDGKVEKLPTKGKAA